MTSQRTLLAIAIASLSSAALADVTLYGSIDETLESVSARGAANSAQNIGQTTRINSNSTFIGFKGSEDLGNGLKAIWQVESAIALDTGAGNFATRDSFVGLTSPSMGMLQLGLLTSSARAMGGIYDINKAATGIGLSAALLGKLGNFAITDPALKTQAAGQIGQFDNRLRNSVQYTTPTFSHFSASALYSAGENGSGPRAYNANLGVKYDNGSLYAGLAYTRSTTGVDDGAALSTSAFRRVDDLRAAAIYRFSANTRIGVIYDRTEGDLTQAGARLYGNRSLKQSVWYVNGSLGIGANGRLIAQYGQAGKLSGGNSSLADSGKAQHYELGYEHDLSKRTLVKVLYSEIRNNSAAKYDFAIGSIGGVAAGADPKGFAVGLRHSF
ncbi:hypothetical protein BXU06_01520 [Aquaspirillum sp. LM1]|uniref:porin n=1 Tax=Aquaspirillum sp. LM1 TaxID=1938604 RepID=UPI000983A879|nr:porin [Aquaspirillum sp. LM1]AQR63894.1 hypothetical protein BXU06_01520 [Aquaspirillum sp. LM1]